MGAVRANGSGFTLQVIAVRTVDFFADEGLVMTLQAFMGCRWPRVLTPDISISEKNCSIKKNDDIGILP